MFRPKSGIRFGASFFSLPKFSLSNCCQSSCSPDIDKSFLLDLGRFQKDALMETISIDASIWEGGGQIFRNSMSLSLILQKQLTIHHIRSNRPTPGLHNQALAVIRAIMSIFGGECSAAVLGSTEIVYTPLPMSEQSRIERSVETGAPVRRFEENVGSAGSLTLVLQALLPCVLLCNPVGGWGSCRAGDTDITLIGGTNVSFSPPMEHFLCVLLPLLRMHMGVHITAQLLKRGFYPRGGGKVHISSVSVAPTKEGEGDISGGAGEILPISLISQGTITHVEIYVYASPVDDSKEEHDRLIEAENLLKNALMVAVTDMLSTVSNVKGNIPISFNNVDDHEIPTTFPPFPPLIDSSKLATLDSSSKSSSSKKEEPKTFTTSSTKHSNSAGGSGGGSQQNNKSRKQKEQKKQKFTHDSHNKQSQKKKVAATLGALVCMHTSTSCVISADAMINAKGHIDEKYSAATSDIVTTILSRLTRTLGSGACIDEQTADQLLVYMALAPGTSEILCAPFCASDHSQHIEAAMDVLTQFTQREFVMTEDTETKCRLIRCKALNEMCLC